MKIISDFPELEGRTFNSIAECEAEESAVKKKRHAEKLEAKKLTDRKKALANAVETADKAVKDAYDERAKVKTEVKSIIEECNSKIIKMLNEANKKVTDAETIKRDAILAYNKEFGAYQAVYTGERAEKELKRVVNQFDDFFVNAINRFIS